MVGRELPTVNTVNSKQRCPYCMVHIVLARLRPYGFRNRQMVQPCATFVSMPGSQSKDGDKPSAVTKFKANLAWTKQKTWDPLEAKLNNLSPLNDRAMRGLSQVLLCNSPVTGALVLSGLTLTAPLTAGSLQNFGSFLRKTLHKYI